MEYQKYDCNSYNIHTIKTDKFKTIRMEIVFSKEAKKEEMPNFTFLCDLITDTSKSYPTRKDITIRLEELYKSIFYGVTNKVGNLFMASFIFEFIAPKYINEDNYLEEAVSFPLKIINNPNVKNNEFELVNFNIVKKRMIQEIESLKENSDKLAISNALKSAFSDSPSSIRVLGSVDDVLKITPASLYKDYEKLFLSSNCDIFIIGNVNMDKIVSIIKDNFQNRVIKLNKPKMTVENNCVKKANKVSSESEFVQSTLVMIYNIKNLTKKQKDIDFHVFNYLLGSGGITSKLYKNLRTDNSLCYGVKSLYLKYDELLIVEVSLDKSNLKLAEKLIKKSVKSMQDGDFSDEMLEDAKKNLRFSLEMGQDNNVAILNNLIFNVFDELPLPEMRINSILEIEKEDILKCAKSLELNTIYIQNEKESK